ncbi:MAG: peroxidase [Acidobacteriota bacterium]
MRAHADDLRAEVDEPQLVEAIARDFKSAPLEKISARAAILCAHAEKLTLTPRQIGAEDIERLRAGGCSDEAIHSATQVTALFNYFNRIADGLGIEPEPEWD